MKRIKSVLCLMCALSACLLIFCGCSPAQKTSAQTAEPTTAEETETTAPKESKESNPEPKLELILESTEPESKSKADTKSGSKPESNTNALPGGYGSGQTVRKLDGIEVVSGRVERVRGNMTYAPGSGKGFFTVNGALSDDSEIIITFNPVGILRYQLKLQSETERTLGAEICVYKDGELLVTCAQKEMKLKEGVNDVDVCIDTGENAPCDGKYVLQFYLDGVLLKENEFEA